MQVAGRILPSKVKTEGYWNIQSVFRIFLRWTFWICLLYSKASLKKGKKSVRRLQNRNASIQIRRQHTGCRCQHIWDVHTYSMYLSPYHLTTVSIKISSSSGRMLMLEHSSSQCCREQRCGGTQMHLHLWPSSHPAASKIKLSSSMLQVLLVLSPSRWPLCLHLPCWTCARGPLCPLRISNALPSPHSSQAPASNETSTLCLRIHIILSGCFL